MQKVNTPRNVPTVSSFINNHSKKQTNDFGAQTGSPKLHLAKITELKVDPADDKHDLAFFVTEVIVD